MKIYKTLARLVAAGALTLSLTACAPTVNIEAAPDSNNPACAEVSVRLPDEIDGNNKRVTNAQATAAWGNPAVVILRCGLPAVEVSTLSCVSAGGVDWLVDDSQSPSYRFISFGRTPATEVIVDSSAIAGVTALDVLSSAVKNIEATKSCSE